MQTKISEFIQQRNDRTENKGTIKPRINWSSVPCVVVAMGMVPHDILQEPVQQATAGNATPSSPHYFSVPGTHEVL